MSDRIDVSNLKTVAFGYDSPLWWGQIWMAVIEGFVFVLLTGAYLYARMHFASWPPAGGNTQGLLLPLFNLALLISSCVPMHIADKAVLHGKWRTVKTGMWISISMGIAGLAIQAYLWSRFEFAWYTNLYGSLVWVILGLHTTHMVAALVETIILNILPLIGYKTNKVRQGLNVDEVYWHFVVVAAVLVYGVVFLAPRML